MALFYLDAWLTFSSRARKSLESAETEKNVVALPRNLGGNLRQLSSRFAAAWCSSHVFSKKSRKIQIEKLENRTQSSEVLFDEKLCKRFSKQYAKKKLFAWKPVADKFRKFQVVRVSAKTAVLVASRVWEWKYPGCAIVPSVLWVLSNSLWPCTEKKSQQMPKTQTWRESRWLRIEIF